MCHGQFVAIARTRAARGKSDPRTRAVATDFVAGWYIVHDHFDRAEQLLTRVIDSLPQSRCARGKE